MSGQWIIITAESRVSALASVAASQGAYSALVVGPRALADVPGAERVLHSDVDAAPEALAAAVADVLATQQPDVLLAGPSPTERVLLAYAAHAVGAPLLTGATAWTVSDGAVTVTRNAMGGISVETLRAHGPVALVVAVDAASTVDGVAPTPEPVALATHGVETVESRAPEGDQVDLGSASRVVAVGRGLKAETDLAMIQRLADALDAQVGCSRPVSEGLGWLPRDRYIGVSGAHLAPRLYVAAGISGQLQHMVGVREADTIVAFESNEKAPIVGQADYVVLGDMYDMIPAVTQELRA